jgi:menaquinone-dependent protoporphyrinogen oxidase
MRILVAFGSKRGGTEGLARWLAEALRESGHSVDLRPAYEPDGLDAYDAVVVGGALYAARWHRSARRFVARHASELSSMPVWFFSSGPLDHSARSQDLVPPTAQVSRLMRLVGAREHVTFGGRLAPDARGAIARAIVRQGRAGDFRDPDRVKAWAGRIADQLASAPANRPPLRAERPRLRPHLRNAVAALCLLSALWAIGGGLALTARSGERSWLTVPGALLRDYPFDAYAMPLLLLLSVIGSWNLVAAMLALGRRRSSELVALAGGLMLALGVAMLIGLTGVHWLLLVQLMMGLAITALSFGLWRILHARARWRQPRMRIEER